jgi:DNA-binding transcriptional MerR regulator
MMTTRQVADFLQVSICSIRRWSSEGILKSCRVGSRGDRRYWRDDVLRFLQDSSQRTTDLDVTTDEAGSEGNSVKSKARRSNTRQSRKQVFGAA